MTLGTLDRTPPPFFNQGPSALSKLMFFSALALLLMVADARFRVTQPLRAALATALYPVQWLALQPVNAVKNGSEYVSGLSQAKSSSEEAGKKLALQSLRAGQVEQLTQENNRLRKLLGLREQLSTSVMAAEVLYDAADPYTRKVIIDKGLAHGVELGSPVLDEAGVLGQVTRVYPLSSEVTMLTDKDAVIPVLNSRTQARGVAFGSASLIGGGMEMRFMAGNADVQAADVLTTSGVDGVYPPGLPVATVASVDRKLDSGFAHIVLTPSARPDGVRHVLVIEPIGLQLPPPPPDAAADGKRLPASKRGNRK